MNLLTLERFKPRDLILLLHLGPLFLIYLFSLARGSQFIALGELRIWIALGLATAIGIASVLVIERKPWARPILHVCLITGLALTVNSYYERPSIVLLYSFLFLALSAWVQELGAGRFRSRYRLETDEYANELVYYSVIFNFLTAITVYFMAAATGILVFAAVIYLNILSAFLYVVTKKRSFISAKAGIGTQVSLVAALVIALSYLSPAHVKTLSYFSILIPCVIIFLPSIRAQFRFQFGNFAEVLFRRPESAVIIFFLILCFLGTVILYSPLSSSGEESLALVDAAFTAVSAACINGLVVLNTPFDFSFFGQVMILLLIQAGGLGIMSMSSLLYFILGRRLSVEQEEVVHGNIGQSVRGEVRTAFRHILAVTFTLEILGAVLLSLFFLFEGDSLPTAVWRGIFTAVSAFCNAGFALQSDSLIAYQSNPAILHTVGLLVIAGGLSPAFIVAIPQILRGRKITMQFKIVALANVFLLFSGQFAYLLLEWNQTLNGMGFFDRLHNSWLQSLTTRSSGFNSVDLAGLHPATIFTMMTLMFIGGSPGGTGGGIRVTTFMILVYTVISVAKGRTDVKAFGRVISKNSVYRAATVTSAGLFVGFIGLLSILTTQRIDPIQALFDIVSASGNVGLSLGAVAQLDQVGKIIFMFLMFFGRVGSLSVILYLGQQMRSANWKYPEEDVSAA